MFDLAAVALGLRRAGNGPGAIDAEQSCGFIRAYYVTIVSTLRVLCMESRLLS